ncbi:acyl carrier protein [Streptantibioticus cattleyicolor]|uniref:Phosphopantetheine attachment site domain-containing protein n=1 Tax=Streptantibioticus cattleyicolor (strain ATCC 35852 / DSM 46488 / JCM 4925 / NBRC 14057 / NRRL 8057) TaxID=1003195 RepID=F8JJJ8_STREN|nr:acyl carrier protein [Streptantibioticus cattleyicolor]AEW98667.1 phosphopantetheine attachment site domain-containing protein [Streptantibioticus cattleyicolor NRRL 8057 = DSM 46488]CCB72275.1 Phosphopantetheine attachment site domain protein (modular protein) [Streptantibioticus cattleyicolor NRRL 8057 = DSM 46488]
MNPAHAALREAVRFAAARRLYGTVILELPHVRATLAGAFADLLAADAAPDPATAYRLRTGALRELAVVMGARGYLRGGTHAAFGATMWTLLGTPPPPDDPAGFDAGLLQAARHALIRWRAARRLGQGDFRADGHWIRAVLLRVAGHRSGAVRPLPDPLTEALVTVLTHPTTGGPEPCGPPPTRQEAPMSEADIRQWLTGRIAGHLGIAPEEIDPGVKLRTYGLDSLDAMTLCVDIEEEYGLTVEPTLVWDHPTVESIAGRLASLLATASTGP